MGSRVIILNHYYLDHTAIIYCNLTVIENHEGRGGSYYWYSPHGNVLKFLPYLHSVVIIGLLQITYYK